MKHGKVTHLVGRPITVGGPLDAAGAWALDPENPSAGTLPFAVEVKNVRSTLYPGSHEVWELLAKVAAFPEVVPVLVARRFHWTTFKFFVDVGALGAQMNTQWFANVDPVKFGSVTGVLGLHDAQLVSQVGQRIAVVTEFFRTAVKPKGIAQRAADRWQETAEIVANYVDLRKADLPQADRTALWHAFVQEMADNDFHGGGWA